MEFISMYTVILAGCDDVYSVLQEAFPRECTVQRMQDIPSMIHQLQEAPADLVLFDLDLPGSRTADAQNALQALLKKSSVLFVGDQALFDPSHPLTAVPAVDYLLRPYTREALILTLETAFYRCEHKKQETEEPLRLNFVRNQIEHYVQEHYGEDLSMQSVAQVMNYSETHFCRLFKQCFKVNFSMYLNEFRIEQAKQLLLSTNLNVKEVAQRCGYQDNSYFIRVFKRFTGMTPMDYRISMQPITRK